MHRRRGRTSSGLPRSGGRPPGGADASHPAEPSWRGVLGVRGAFFWGVCGVLCVAAALRALYLADVLSHPILGDFVILDAEVYDETADRIAAGDWWGGDTAYPFGPLYFYFLAVERRLLGDSRAVTYAVQQLLGLASLLVSAGIARRCFGDAAGVAAAAVMTLYAPIALMETKLLSETVALFLGVVAIDLMQRARDGHWRAGWALAGLFLGLTCLARPNTVLFAPVACLWALWDGAGTASGGRWWAPARLPAALTLAAGIAAGILPATARNYALDRDFVLISTQGGLVFYQANNEHARGIYHELPGFSGDPRQQAREQQEIAERELGRELAFSEVNRYWLAKGLAFWAREPGRALLLELRKLRYWLGSQEPSGEYVLKLERRLVPTLWLMPIPFGLILALAVLGARATGLGDPRHVLLHLFILVNLGSALLFLVTSRYRVPAVPLLCAFAGAGCIALVRRARAPRKGLVLWLAPAVVLLAVSLQPWTNDESIQAAHEYFNLGNEFVERGRDAEAEASYLEALRVIPRRWQIHFNLGNVYYRRQDWAAARRHYARVLEIHPEIEQRDAVERRIRALDAKTGH